MTMSIGSVMFIIWKEWASGLDGAFGLKHVPLLSVSRF